MKKIAGKIHQGCAIKARKLISLDNYKAKHYNCNQDEFYGVHLSSFRGINFHHRASTCGEYPSTIILQTAYCLRKSLFGIFLFVFSLLPCFSYDNFEIANALKLASIQNDIDKRILYTLAKIESNFNPLVISFTSKQNHFSFKNLTKRTSRYKDKYLINFLGEEKDLQEALRHLMRQGIKVDVGLMQINSTNFKEKEIPFIFNPSYNVKKSLEILKYCIKEKRIVKDSIECYNKGANRTYQSYEYYKRFYISFLKDFT